MSFEPRRVPWHEDIEVRGLRHRLTWWGERTRTPIVLLHGFLDCGATWQFLADCLPPAWTLVAPDWRGFGASEWAPGGYWFPDYFADLEVLLDTLVPEGRARVVGHSMGANVADMYGGVRPRRLEWLVNLEGLGLARNAPDEAPKRYAQWLDELQQPLRAGRYESLAQLTSVLKMRNPRLTQDRAEFIARAWSRPEFESPGGSGPPGEGGIRLRFDPRHRRVNPVLYRREEAEACWSRLEIPMLLVTGERSAHRSRMSDEELRLTFKDVRTVIVPDAGHMMHHEDPETVGRHIIEFERACASSAP